MGPIHSTSFSVALGTILHIQTEIHVPNCFFNVDSTRPVTFLKTLDTIGKCQRPVFSLAVSQHMHKITNLWKFELNWSSNLRDNYERKKHPCHTKLCAFRWLIFETSSSKSEVFKSNSWKITSFSKTTFLQREPFLTMFYTINLSPLIVTKWGIILIIILSSYQ